MKLFIVEMSIGMGDNRYGVDVESNGIKVTELMDEIIKQGKGISFLNINSKEEMILQVGNVSLMALSHGDEVLRNIGIVSDGIEIKLLKNLLFSSNMSSTSLPVQQNVQNVPNLQYPQGQVRNPRAKSIRDYLAANPDVVSQIIERDPEMAQALFGDDDDKLESLILRREEIKRDKEKEEIERMRKLNENPFDPTLQSEIEDQIMKGNVQDNLEQAIEHVPEAFGRVVMLYIDCKVNDVPIKAFVDSGAQQTIMNKECAERCNIMRLADVRFEGTAVGVGSAKILGRVHVTQIQIGSSFFHCSINVLQNPQMDFLLGLDFLRRHLSCIDLKENLLRIGDETTPFLSEKDIPSKEKFMNVVQPPQQQQQQQGVGGQPPTQPPSGEFPEGTVQQLQGLGFPREKVIEALRACGGNAEVAASLLMGDLGF